MFTWKHFKAYNSQWNAMIIHRKRWGGLGHRFIWWSWVSVNELSVRVSQCKPVFFLSSIRTHHSWSVCILFYLFLLSSLGKAGIRDFFSISSSGLCSQPSSPTDFLWEYVFRREGGLLIRRLQVNWIVIVDQDMAAGLHLYRVDKGIFYINNVHKLTLFALLTEVLHA